MFLILLSEQPQMHLLNMLCLGWAAKQLKWDDMEQVNQGGLAARYGTEFT